MLSIRDGSRSILPSSLARQTQGSQRSSGGPIASALFICTHPGASPGLSPVQRVSASSYASITGLAGQRSSACIDRDTSKWSKHYRKALERSGQTISLNVLASNELCRNVYLEIHTWCLWNTLQSTLQSKKAL